MSHDDEGARPEDKLALALKGMSVMRHDLRNLLSSVSIIASRLEALGDDRLTRAGGEITTNMEGIVALGVAAQELVEIEPAEARPAGIHHLVALGADAAGIAVDTEGLGDEEVAVCESQAARALELVIANAGQANGKGKRPQVSSRREDGQVVIEIADEGGGIPDYALGTLFTPFTGMKRRGGAGLGLPIAARLAKINGGSVSVARTGPEGTVIAIALPAA